MKRNASALLDKQVDGQVNAAGCFQLQCSASFSQTAKFFRFFGRTTESPPSDSTVEAVG